MSNIDDKLNEVLNIAEEVLDKKEDIQKSDQFFTYTQQAFRAMTALYFRIACIYQ